MDRLERQASAGIQGHDILALERFMDSTRHMIEFDVLTCDSPVGDKGSCYRTFLSDDGYKKALENQRLGNIKIRRHATVIEDHLLYDRKKQQRER